MEYVIIDYKKTNRDRLLSMEQNNMDKQQQKQQFWLNIIGMKFHQNSPMF